MEKDLFQDIVWIGTDGQGIYLYSSKQPPIKSVTFNKSENKISRPVRALLWDKERTLWVGLKGEGLLKVYNYNPNKEISEFKSEKITSKNSELKSNAVYSIAQSQRNILWIGTEEGLNYYSYKENKTKKISLTVDGTEFKYIHGVETIRSFSRILTRFKLLYKQIHIRMIVIQRFFAARNPTEGKYPNKCN